MVNRLNSANRPRRRKKNSHQRQGNSPKPKTEKIIDAGQAAQMPTLPYASVKLSDNIADSTNQKIMDLISGISHLKNFIDISQETESDFAQKNQAQIEKLVNLDIQKSYDRLLAVYNLRDQLYQDLVNKNILTEAEKNYLLGVVSSKPYSDLISSIKAADLPNPNPDNLKKLTDDDEEHLQRVSSANLEQLLNQLHRDKKLTEQQRNRLQELGPKTAQQIEEARNQAFTKIHRFDINNHTNYLDKYRNVIDEEGQATAEIDGYIDQYNKITRSLVSQIEETFNSSDNSIRRQQALDDLCQKTGLPIRTGEVFYGEDWSFDPLNQDISRERNKKIQITDITFGGYKDDKGYTYPSFEPIISFNAELQDGSGRIAPRKMPATQFSQWLIRNNVCQKIDSLHNLENELGLSNKLKIGKVLTFQAIQNVPNADGKEQLTLVDQQVTITAIDADSIVFDQEVVLDRPMQGLRQGRKSKKLSFGDFARWYRQNEVIFGVKNIQELNQELINYNQQLEKEIGLNPKENPPIDLTKSKPIFLMSVSDLEEKPVEVIQADDQQIILADGQKLNPTQFLRLVRDHDLVVPNAADLQSIKEMKLAQGKEDLVKKLDQEIKKLSVPVGVAAPPKSESVKPNIVSSPQSKSVFDRAKGVWKNTNFISLMQLYEMLVKIPTQKIKDKLKDASERRFAAVAKDFYQGIPYIGASLSGKYQAELNSKNADDIKKIKEGWETEGKTVGQILEILYTAEDKKKFKAALEVLSPKGILRFADDGKLHNRINILFPNHVYPEKFPDIKGEKVVVGAQPEKAKGKIKVNVEDQIRIIFDKEYAEGVFDSFYRQNEGEYDKRKAEFNNKYRDEEFYGIGLVNKIRQIITDFEDGKPVDAAQFEGLLQAAVSNNEIPPQQSVFLFICAFGARKKNPTIFDANQSLIPIHKLNPFFGAYKDNPIFTYFTGNFPQRDEKGNIIYEENTDEKGNPIPRKAHMGVNEFRVLYDQIVTKDIAENMAEGRPKFQAGRHTTQWIQSEILTLEKIEKKMSQRIGSADPSIYHFVGPLLYADHEIDRLVTTGSNNSREDSDVLKNQYVGYNSHLLVRSNRLREAKNQEEQANRTKQLSNMLYGAIYFDDAIRGKIINRPNRYDYINFKRKDYESNPAADEKRQVVAFVSEIREYSINFIKGVARINGNAELEAAVNKFLVDPSPVEYDDEKAFRIAVDEAINQAGKTDYAKLADLAENCALGLKGMSGQQAVVVKKD